MGKTFKTPVVATTLMREEVEHLARRKRPGGFNLDMQTAIPVFGYFGATIPLRAPMLERPFAPCRCPVFRDIRFPLVGLGSMRYWRKAHTPAGIAGRSGGGVPGSERRAASGQRFGSAGYPEYAGMHIGDVFNVLDTTLTVMVPREVMVAAGSDALCPRR